jgi:hypothetical protein
MPTFRSMHAVSSVRQGQEAAQAPIEQAIAAARGIFRFVIGGGNPLTNDAAWLANRHALLVRSPGVGAAPSTRSAGAAAKGRRDLADRTRRAAYQLLKCALGAGPIDAAAPLFPHYSTEAALPKRCIDDREGKERVRPRSRSARHGAATYRRRFAAVGRDLLTSCSVSLRLLSST